MDEEEDPIDEEQLDEYREMVDDLGAFPDKVKINSLSMVAEDHAESPANAAAIYGVIRTPLVAKNVSSDKKLPLVYVIDSILKNVKGSYIPVIEEDAKTWMPVVYDALPDDKRAKLKKVWNLWKGANIFKESKWQEMGSCFSATSATAATRSSSDAVTSNPELENAGISWGKDGSLLLMPNLKEAMQSILDDLQSDVTDELEKVSLERLAAIDSALLIKIKQTAEDSLRSGSSKGRMQTSNEQPQEEDDILSFLVETRTAEAIEQSSAWQKLNLNHVKDAHEIMASLQRLLRDGSSIDKRYTQREALDTTAALAAAAVTAGLLTANVEELSKSDKNNSAVSSILGMGAGQRANPASVFVKVDKSLFTNDGLKKRNDAIVGVLYDAGLPFVSSTDGRRFATQVELSEHLDALFKKGQLEKAMATTEERGWYISDSAFSLEKKMEEMQISNPGGGSEADDPAESSETEADPDSFTELADESRDRCVICGLNFKMYFDNDDGVFKYKNCREIEVLNDETAIKESEEMLVHVSCWRNMGCPPQLNPEQALQEFMNQD
ncbi:unnamed protein product [Cylindrotheca closterium]|uniref:CID domain-containing protein n=1 Tax=Cylindrotheca closterium TaxID=2856 RepID=A0AAD2FWG4_9STRA|nr:unnamed protein product [Cylindrotheca closterium]